MRNVIINCCLPHFSVSVESVKYFFALPIPMPRLLPFSTHRHTSFTASSCTNICSLLVQQLPLKHRTIGKKIISLTSDYLPLTIDHIKTSYHRVQNTPCLFIVIALIIIIDATSYYYFRSRHRGLEGK